MDRVNSKGKKARRSVKSEHFSYSKDTNNKTTAHTWRAACHLQDVRLIQSQHVMWGHHCAESSVRPVALTWVMASAQRNAH